MNLGCSTFVRVTKGAGFYSDWWTIQALIREAMGDRNG